MQEETDSSARAIASTPFAALSKYLDTPLGLLVLVIASVFVADALVMVLFIILPPPSPLPAIFLDALLLIVLVFPALYIFLLRPLTRQIQELHDEILERQRVEAALRESE